MIHKVTKNNFFLRAFVLLNRGGDDGPDMFHTNDPTLLTLVSGRRYTTTEQNT